MSTVITAPRFTRRARPQTHRAARLARLQHGDRSRTAVFTNAAPRADREFASALRSTCSPTIPTMLSPAFLQANVIRNAQAAPRAHEGWRAERLSVQNFTPLRPVKLEGGLLERAARDIPWESRFDLLKRMKTPEFCSEGGTPRRAFQAGVVQGIRVRAVQNPYYSPNKRELRQMNTWRSRDFANWSPHLVSVRGGSRKFAIPDALMPTKDELGETHPPALSARYAADVKRQFILHGLPWMYAKDFGKLQTHFRDRAPKIRRRWIRRELRLAKIEQALKNMDTLVDEYRKEKKAAKPNSWFDKVVNEIAGDQVASLWIRKPKTPKH